MVSHYLGLGLYHELRHCLYEETGQTVKLKAMHELSIAQNVIDSVLSEATKNRAKKVLVIEVSIGELMQLDKDAFVYSFSLLRSGPMLRAAKLELKIEKASFSCRKCSRSWSMDETRKQLRKVEKGLLIRELDGTELPLHFLPQLYSAFIHCPECGSSDILLKGGESIQITKLVVE
jgi:hydrogenase nickel insertion protein HypA